METRVCKRCEEEKPLDDEHFYRQGTSRGGFRQPCISCVAKWHREYGQKITQKEVGWGDQLVNEYMKRWER